ncbi:MAG: response regulator transcription factor [Acinetobacter sp.]|jgi:DNA-binding NarL/FixJ family response regulator|nr:MAG: response regulator transcription factor [Acinetobacter sp.]
MINQSSNLPMPVLIIEDDKVIQQRLQHILMAIGYTKSDILFTDTLKQSLAIIKKQQVAFVLVDLGLPDGNGTKFIQTFRQKNETIPVLVISAWSTREAILKAIQAGATGYLLKERDDFEVSMSIKHVLQGGTPIDPFMAQLILSTVFKKPQPLQNSQEALSSRELEILEYVVQGMNNQDIANLLELSRYTIEAHLRNIYSKLAVDSRSKAIKIAHSLGFF